MIWLAWLTLALALVGAAVTLTTRRLRLAYWLYLAALVTGIAWAIAPLVSRLAQTPGSP